MIYVEDLITKLVQEVDTLDDVTAVSLLTKELPKMPYWYLKKIDDEAKEDLAEWRNNQAYITKVIAARGFESMEYLMSASFSYDRATKCALTLNLPMAAIRCSWRSLRLYQKRIEESKPGSKRRRLKKDLRWAKKRVNYSYDLYLGRD